MIQNTPPPPLKKYNTIIDTNIYVREWACRMERAREKKKGSVDRPNVVGPRPMAYMTYW